MAHAACSTHYDFFSVFTHSLSLSPDRVPVFSLHLPSSSPSHDGGRGVKVREPRSLTLASALSLSLSLTD